MPPAGYVLPMLLSFLNVAAVIRQRVEGSQHRLLRWHRRWKNITAKVTPEIVWLICMGGEST